MSEILVGAAEGTGKALSVAPAVDVPSHPSDEEAEKEEEIDWFFSASVLGYIVPDDRDFAQLGAEF